MTKVFKGEFKFRSLINRETSFNQINLSEDTESSIEVEIRENGSGWFEWDIPELEETESGQLNFEDNELVDYDGVFSLPQQLVDFLQNEGYNMEYTNNI